MLTPFTTSHLKWFVPVSHNHNAKCRLICFPYAGGGPSAFRNWENELPDDVDIVCAHLPGRELRFNEPLLDDLSVIVSLFADAAERYTTLPYAIFGHSLGALIGQRLIAALAQRGLPEPAHFIASGRSAPSDSRSYYQKISHLSDEDFLHALQQYRGTPVEVAGHQELMALYMPILRADFLLSEAGSESKAEKIKCPISVFAGIQDRIPLDRLQLWNNETSAKCEIHMFEGGHFFINESKSSVLEKISSLLGKLG